MIKHIKELKTVNKIILLLSISILLVLIYKGDYISDEISAYYRFDMEKVFQKDLSPLVVILKKGDHSPIYFLVRAIAFKITKGLMFFRYLSLLAFLYSYFLIRDIVKEKFKERYLLILFDIFILLNPFILYEVSISSKYIFMSFFLIYAFFKEVNKTQKNEVLKIASLILAVLTHYFALFFITLYYFFNKKIRYKKVMTLIFLLLSIFVFINLFNIFSSHELVRGESSYISSSYSEIVDASDLKYFSGTIGKLLTRPQIYGTDTKQSDIDIVAGILILLIFLYFLFKKDQVSITFFSFMLIFYLISIYFLKSNNIIFFEANRLTFLIFPLIYLLITYIRRSQFKLGIILLISFFYLNGFFIMYEHFPDELSKINAIISERPARLFSYSPEYKGNYDEANLLRIRYKKEFDVFKGKIDEKDAYLFTNNNFKYYLSDRKRSIESLLSGYNINKVFKGRKYSLYYIKR